MAAESNHKPALLEVAEALREVHRALVAATRATYEREVAPAGGPGHMLRLLTEDPFFAWLHPMSELIVDLDALLAQELLPAGTVAGVRLEVDRLTQAGASRCPANGGAGMGAGNPGTPATARQVFAPG